MYIIMYNHIYIYIYDYFDNKLPDAWRAGRLGTQRRPTAMVLVIIPIIMYWYN